ncbi:MAG: hypothetical protein Q7S00_05455, partial [bacterium]|nr:hypothetical protein [bacterium]
MKRTFPLIVVLIGTLSFFGGCSGKKNNSSASTIKLGALTGSDLGTIEAESCTLTEGETMSSG